MAAATYNTDLTGLVENSTTTGNWAATGGGAGGLNAEGDYFIEGAECISKNAWTAATKGMVEDTTNNLLTALSGKAVFTWVTYHIPNVVAAKSVGGYIALMGSAVGTLNRYFYSGSDEVDYGAPWICMVVDPDEGTQNSGAVATGSIDTYGAEIGVPVGGPTKGSPLGIDDIRYGRSIEINDGAGGSPANFTDMAAQNDLIGNRWGQFQRVPGSLKNFTQQCRVEFGDTTNTVKAVFVDSDRNIAINNLEHVASDFIEFDVTQASDVTLTNINFDAIAGGNTRGNWVTTSAGTVIFNNVNWTNFGLSTYDSSYTINGGTYRGADLVTAGGATFNSPTFAISTATSALLLSSTSTLNTGVFEGDETATPGHAVDLGTRTGGTSGVPLTLSWDSTLDNGATNQSIWEGAAQVPTTGTSGTANSAITINVPSGSFFKISVSGSGTVPTVQNTGTGSLEITANEVTITITAIDQDTALAVEGASVYMKLTLGDGATVVANGSTNASGIFTTTYGGSVPVSLDTDISAVRDSSGAKPYNDYILSGQITSSGYSQTALMSEDQTMDYKLDFDTGSGSPYTEGEQITFTGGGIAELVMLYSTDDIVGEMYFSLISGSVPADGETMTGGTSGETLGAVNGTHKELVKRYGFTVVIALNNETAMFL